MRALLAALCLAVLGGCQQKYDRPPPPTVKVEIFSAFEYTIDGETVTKPVLKERLRELADKHRRPIVNNSRVYMHIVGVGPGTGDDVQEIMSYCMSVGLDKIRVGQ